jgi:hypothetical protein
LGKVIAPTALALALFASSCTSSGRGFFEGSESVFVDVALIVLVIGAFAVFGAANDAFKHVAKASNIRYEEISTVLGEIQADLKWIKERLEDAEREAAKRRMDGVGGPGSGGLR